jgi:hypothetical protein
MRTRAEIFIWGGVVVASLGVHAVAFGGLGHSRSDGFGRKQQRRPTTVEMSVAPSKALPPALPKPSVKSAPRVAMARPTQTKAPPSSAPLPPSSAPPPADESPADFTGVTMTNDGPGDGWSSATGNGAAMKGPVGRPSARVTDRNADGDSASNSHAAGPRVVGFADLSRAPAAPDLTDVLAQAYPAAARSKGLTGKAVVRARVMPDGKLRELALLSESAIGFGAACQQTLRGSAWTSPLDRGGNAVSTFINYTCRFNVQ